MPPKHKVYKSNVIKYNKNANNLLIVESPSKCSKIETFLGDDYACIASVGHLQTINSLKDIDTKNDYKPQFKIIEEKKGHILQMKKIISNFSPENIYIATDDDREGEAIAWHICILFCLDINNTKRIIFHEITKSAVVNAVQNPTVINLNLVYAQFSRQILDIIVGFKITPFLWKYLFNNKENSLSAGRCQTPALKLIYDNYKNNTDDINMTYKVIGNFTSHNINFNLNKNINNYEDVKRFFKESIDWNYKISIGNKKQTTVSSPTPFSTSKLLQIAGNTLNLSPKHTMSICQKLYQAGYITYMRTESTKYAGAFISHANKYIISKYGENYIGNNKKIQNFDINNPHEAIRVTSLTNMVINDNKDPKTNSLYKLIYNNTIESCMKEYTANISVISINSPFKNINYEYKNEIPIFFGWKIVKKMLTDMDTNKSAAELLYFETLLSNKINYNMIRTNVSITTNNMYYSEHSLINKLESLGIGRPSTFASIIDVIQTRNYVEKKNIEAKIKKIDEFILEDGEIKEEKIEKKYGEEKNKLIITNLGVLTIEFLHNNFDNIFSYDYTKEMEKELDDIATGINSEWNSLCKSCDIEIKNKSKNINVSKNAFKLDDKYDIVFEKYGPCLRYEENGETKYEKIKKDIDLNIDKIINKEYNLNDIIEIEDDLFLGKYKENDVYKKIGRYGPYIEYNGKSKSIKPIKKEFRDIRLEDVIPIINETNSNIFREFTPCLSIRKGKYGAYAYFKKENMRKPQFYNIKKFDKNFNECSVETFIEWLCNNYDTKPEDFV
tara:strand:+ start:229 stop:2580 length:2352 start_codon:yes stop_codon:yes gene_type:complete